MLNKIWDLCKYSIKATTFAGIFRDGVGTDHSSVHANFIPLAFGLVPEDKLAGVISWLEEKNMQCSVYAAQYLMEGLFNHGSDVKAIELMIADGDRWVVTDEVSGSVSLEVK